MLFRSELIDDQTTVILVSDHGFHPDHLRPRELPNEPAGPAEEHRAYDAHGRLVAIIITPKQNITVHLNTKGITTIP